MGKVKGETRETRSEEQEVPPRPLLSLWAPLGDSNDGREIGERCAASARKVQTRDSGMYRLYTADVGGDESRRRLAADSARRTPRSL